ncbi:MAG: hypothetical protein J6L88_06025 [Clostridia bacterium]|nr:hypothetical protein [Clostridia bacterium]
MRRSSCEAGDEVEMREQLIRQLALPPSPKGKACLLLCRGRVSRPEIDFG